MELIYLVINKMTITKKKISKNIAKNIKINESEALLFSNTFFELMRRKISSNTVKISGFGSFYKTVTPARLGRNPKTKEEHPIPIHVVTILSISLSTSSTVNVLWFELKINLNPILI